MALTGARCNRSAIGARCSIEAGERKQFADVLRGCSYYSQSSLALYFGVGDTDRIDRLEARWPNGERQVWRGIATNGTLAITKGRDEIRRRAWTERE